MQFAQMMGSVSDLACHHKRVVADQLLLLIFRVQKRDIFKDHMGTCESIRTTPSHRHTISVACPHDSFLLMIMHSFVLLQDPPLGGDMLLSCWQTTIAPVMTCTTVVSHLSLKDSEEDVPPCTNEHELVAASHVAVEQDTAHHCCCQQRDLPFNVSESMTHLVQKLGSCPEGR